MILENRKSLLFILLGAIALNLFCFAGIIGSDDMQYVRRAYDILTGKYHLGPVYFSMRIGLLYPLSIFFKLFGINEISAIALPFLFSIGNILLMYLLGKHLFNEKTGIIAACLMATVPMNVVYATMLFPDTQMYFLSTFSILLLFLSEQRKSKMLFFLTGLIFGLAYLTKIMVILLIPLTCIYSVWQIKKHNKPLYNYLLIGIGFASIILLESIYYYVKTGDFLFRLHATQAYNLQPLYSGLRYTTSTKMLLRRTFFDLPFSLTFQFFRTSFIYWFILPAFIILRPKKNKQVNLVFSWFFGLFLLFNFMPTQLYPRFLLLYIGDPRELMILLAPAILIVAFFFEQWMAIDKVKILEFKQIKFLVIMAITLLIINPVLLGLGKTFLFRIAEIIYNLENHIRTFSENRGLFVKLYNNAFRSFIALSIVTVTAISSFLLFSRDKRLHLSLLYKKVTVSVLLLICLFMSNVVFSLTALPLGAGNIREIHNFLQKAEEKPIYIDFVNGEVLKFYFGYKKNYLFHSLYTSDLLSLKDCYVIIDKDCINYIWKIKPEVTPKRLLAAINNPPENWIRLIRIHPEFDGNSADIYYAK